MQDTCGIKFITDDSTLTCGKNPGRHFLHRDQDTGARFIRCGKGGLIFTDERDEK